jgi:hypothetical protein
MTAVSVLPLSGEVMWDARDGGRFLRLGWHSAENLCVLSMWRDDRCVSTFQLTREATPELIAALVRGLAAAPATPWAPPTLTRVPSSRGRASNRLLSWFRR